MSEFQEIEVNGEMVEFPADMSDEQIASAIKGHSANTIYGGFPALGRSAAGALDVLGTLGSGLVGRLAGGVAAAPVSLSNPEESKAIFDKVSSGLTLGPFTDTGSDVLESIAPIAEKIDRGITDVFSHVPGGPVAQTIAKTAATAPLELLGGRALHSGLSKVGPPATVGPPAPKNIIPEVGDLFKSGSQAFDRARNFGGGIKPESFERLANGINNLKEKSGLSVRINETLHPQSFAVRNEILDTIAKKGDSLSFDDLVELRQIASDAAGTKVPADARIATIMRKEIDSYVDSLSAKDMVGGNPRAASASLNEARDLWRRASKGKTIETEIELAGISANSFHGAGFENALRTQFKQLSRRIAKGHEPGFSPAEIEMIRKVANGGKLDNVFRWIGKLAPTGVVSGGLAGGAGYVAGGPLGAAAVLGAGAAARSIATQRTIGNANRASGLVRGTRYNTPPGLLGQ